MKDNTIKFYSSRMKTGLISVIFFFIAYMAYTKILADPFGTTEIGRIFIWFIVVFVCVMATICLIKTFDPRPIIEIMPEGLLVRTFMYKETLILWSEIVHIEQEKHTNHVINTSAYVKVTTRILRIHRPRGRSLAVNLTLLNKRGNTLMDTFYHYADPSHGHTEAERRGMSDERLLEKYHQAKQKKEKVYANNFTRLGKLGSLFLSIIMILWALNFFRTIDFNPVAIFGFIAAFFIMWFVLMVVIDFIQLFIVPFDTLKAKVDGQANNYLTILRQRINPEQVVAEQMEHYPLLMKDHAYYEEDGEYISFYPVDHAGQTEQIVLHKEDISIREIQEADATAAYCLYALKISQGVFTGEKIDELRELHIPIRSLPE